MARITAVARIKICGLTNEADARHAAACGAHFLGLVLAESPRRADPAETARWLPGIRRDFPHVQVVGVFVRPAIAGVTEAVSQLGLDLVQVHGLESESATPSSWPRPLILAVAPDRLAAAAAARPWAVLADQVGSGGGGGTGMPLDWDALSARVPSGVERLFLAGGLDAGNVSEAIRLVQPWAVDASSRLELAPGVKDPVKVAAFCDAVRAADGAGTRSDN